MLKVELVRLMETVLILYLLSVASNIRSDGEPLLGLITFRNSTPIVVSFIVSSSVAELDFPC